MLKEDSESRPMKSITYIERDKKFRAWLIENAKQVCPSCGDLIGHVRGTKDAICQNCGFKDPCCE